MPASGKVGATTTEDDPSRGLVRGTAASVTTGASRRPGAGLQLERTNLPTRREVARAEATGELLATLREHDTPRRPRPDARPSRAAPLVCLRLTPDHSTSSSAPGATRSGTATSPTTTCSSTCTGRGARRCWQRRRNNQQQQQQQGRQEEGYEGSRAAVRER